MERGPPEEEKGFSHLEGERERFVEQKQKKKKSGICFKRDMVGLGASAFDVGIPPKLALSRSLFFSL